jgi:hypothetical protein
MYWSPTEVLYRLIMINLRIGEEGMMMMDGHWAAMAQHHLSAFGIGLLTDHAEWETGSPF